MKKICHITSVHPIFDPRIFYKEANTLAKAGYNVVLIAPHDRDEIINNIKIISLPKVRFLKRIFYLDRKIYKIALEQKADIYHFHDPELLPFGVKLKKKTKAKVIYDVHEDVPKQILSKYQISKILRKPVAIIFNFYEKRKVKIFDFIITVGKDVRERFKKLNPNIETIKNFPILSYFENFKKSQKRNIFNVIYVGGLARIRGITEIIKAMDYLPNKTGLTLLGRFSPESYQRSVRKLEGYKKVRYLGKVNFDKVPFYLFQADVGIICLWPQPNYYNSAEPTKLFEYMAAGLPVVASNFPLWKKIVEGNNCGICVNPLDPKEIAKAIEYLIEHPDEAKRMGENGRRTVLKKYNWESEAQKLLSAYEKLTKE